MLIVIRRRHIEYASAGLQTAVPGITDLRLGSDIQPELPGILRGTRAVFQRSAHLHGLPVAVRPAVHLTHLQNPAGKISRSHIRGDTLTAENSGRFFISAILLPCAR